MIVKQTLSCVEPGCSSPVIYEPRPVGGGPAYKPKPNIRVYLVCAKGHCHDYYIKT